MLKIFKKKNFKKSLKSIKLYPSSNNELDKNPFDPSIPVVSKKTGLSSFSKKYYVTEIGKIVSIIVGATMNFFAIGWFISPTKTYGGGLLGAALIFYYLIIGKSEVSPDFYQLFLIQLALNVPLIIFGFIKLGYKFTFLTLLYFSIQIILGISLQNSPAITAVVNNLFHHTSGKIPRSWIMVSCLIGGVLYGSGCVFVYNGAGSTGGTDFISVYLTKTRNKTIGLVNFALNLLVALIGTLVLTKSILGLFSVTFFGSIMFFGIYSFIIDYFLPKQRIVSMHIISKNEYLIAKAFKEADLTRGYTKILARGGYANDTNIIFFVVLSLHEYRILVNIIKKYDPNAFIISNYVWKVKGNFKKKTWE